MESLNVMVKHLFGMKKQLALRQRHENEKKKKRIQKMVV